MRTFMTLLAKELRESWKTSRLLIVGLLFLVFGLMSPLLAKYTPDLLKALGTQSGGVQISIPPPTVQDTVAQFLKNVGGNGILVALILGVGLVVREKERGTAAFVLTKPVTCGTFLAAKFARLAIELTVGVVLAAIADAYYTALLFRPLDLPGFIACCALLLLGLLSIGGVAFLGSTLMPSTVAAIGFAVGAWVVLAVLSALPHIGPYIPGVPDAPALAVALGHASAELGPALIGNVGGILVAALASWAIFRQQEQMTAE